MLQEVIKTAQGNQKVELKVDEYNQLVRLANANTVEIAKEARNLYLKYGVVSIHFYGCFFDRNFEREEFECKVCDYDVEPHEDDFHANHLFHITRANRKRISKFVASYVTDVFNTKYGEHLENIKVLREMKRKEERRQSTFLVSTVIGWLLAMFMLCVVCVLTHK